MFLTGQDLHRVGPLVVRKFLQNSCQIQEKTKKVLPFKSGAPGAVPYYSKSGPSYGITFIKTLDESLRQQLSEEKPSISPELRL